MKKRLSVLTAGLLSVSMLVTGCGSGQASSESQVKDSGVAGEKVDIADLESADDGSVYNVATVRWADWGEDYHTGFPDEAAEEVGISIKWDTMLNSDWSDKKAVLMAGGNLPDAFMGSICFTESDILTNQDSFIAIDSYIDEYMPNLKAIMEKDPTMKALATSADGHIYGLPSKKPCRPVIANQMFINKTWLDNLGLKVPTTYEEYEDVLTAFKEQDANGNGDPSDEIPFGQGYADSVMFFCLPFGTTIGADNTSMMTVKNGEPIFIPTSEEYKEGIRWMNECFEAGLIDAELFTEDESMRDAKLMSETPIVGSAPGWTADATFGANAYQYVALPALKGPSGNQYICSDPEHWNMSRYEFVVTSACKDPGPLLAWADRFYTDDASIQNFYGSFGVGVEKNEDGTYMVLPPKDGNSADTFAWISSLRDFGPKYVDDGFNDKVKYAAENGDAAKLELDRELAKYAKEAFPNVSYTTDQLNTLATLYADIDAFVKSSQATWVSEGGVDEAWDGYIEQLNAMGYDEFIKIQQDAYSAYMSNK